MPSPRTVVTHRWTMGSRKQLITNLSDAMRETPELHIALLGEQGVGKSALTVKYITKRFIMEYDPTLEDTYTKSETLEGQDVTVKIMDTYDTEDSNPDRYLKWAHGFVVVYSITQRSTWDTARASLETVARYQRITGKDLPIKLVGNKVDLERYRTVSRASGESLAEEFEGCTFCETSAAEDLVSVESMFQTVIRDVARTKERQMTLQPLFISEDKAGMVTLTSSSQAGAGGHSAQTGAGGSGSGGRGTHRRHKAPKAQDHIHTGSGGTVANSKSKEEKESKLYTRRTGVTSFKLFNLNKGFKIFN